MKRFVVEYGSVLSPSQFEEHKRFESRQEAEREAEQLNFGIFLRTMQGQTPNWLRSWGYEVRELSE